MILDKFLVPPDTSVIKAMKIIDENAKGIVFVYDSGKLLGTVTDGDIRRYILSHGNLYDKIIKIANVNTVWLEVGTEQKAAQIMTKKSISAIPVLNRNKEIVKIYFSGGECVERKGTDICRDIPLVIMAGGKGTRLKPYTDILPKPLIPIGDKTITERIIDKFIRYGCSDVYMIVNYKKDFIKAYFKDSPYRGLIHFIDEVGYMGTGGGLKFAEGKFSGTFFMSNCDILVEADYTEILNQHRIKQNCITMICAKKNFSIPYGTVCMSEDNEVTELIEKPSHTFLVNTGFYVLEPEVLEIIPEDTFIHITEIIGMCMKKNHKVGAYIIEDDNWMDMGQFDEMEKMKQRLES